MTSKMESSKLCRICLTETQFSVSLFGSYSQKSSLLDKILVCLRLPIEQNERLNTICHRCTHNVERYYDFINQVKKAQNKISNGGGNSQRYDCEPRNEDVKLKQENNANVQNVHMNRFVTSYVREQVYDADYTFSFLDTPKNEDAKRSSPLFSCFSPPHVPLNQPMKETDKMWKTSQQKPARSNALPNFEASRAQKCRKERPIERAHQSSRDLFESQSQDVEEPDIRKLDWKLTPDDNIIKRIREKCFGLSDF